MDTKAIEQQHFSTPEEWRAWLMENHEVKEGIWMVCYKKGAAQSSISWREAVDQALCFGWIDSRKKTVNNDYSLQFFGKRKPKSTWSKINKDKVAHLLAAGLMTKLGLESIQIAQENGSWTILDDVEALIIPEDLRAALSAAPTADLFFQSLSKSNKKMLLQWVVLAKQPKTRKIRIDEIVSSAAQCTKPKAFTR